jgi:lipid-A-disaccharide synthase-like uncharacterized protein
MRRRWIVMLELLCLCAILVWVGLALKKQSQGPEGAIDLKVQLKGADDRAFLLRTADGALRYEIRLADGSAQQLAPDEFAQRLYHDQTSRGMIESLLNITSPAGIVWVTLGFLGQLLFTGRMLVQWLISEQSRRSVIPTAFWWMSLAGASMLLAYFLWRRDPIGVLGQATGWFIYVRNLWMIYRIAPAAK